MPDTIDKIKETAVPTAIRFGPDTLSLFGERP